MSYKYEELDKRLISVVPSTRQVEYQQREFYGFIHFTVNTYTNKEWGLGDESPEIFNPYDLDAESWVKAAVSAGMKGLILTCKHHDGFCLWPSKYTEHSVKNSPYKDGKGDIVKELSDACKKYGVKFGVYLSPWDRNCAVYGTGKEYDDFYINQMTELLTNYGDVYTFWMDGACGEGPNGKKQVYDWERYYAKVRELQPEAVLSICGPDVRWCGNEAGVVRKSEWSVVSKLMTSPAFTAELSQKEDNEEFRKRAIDPTNEELGSREVLENEPELAWYPAETDLSIRPGWFYHPEEDDKVRSLENLKDIYLKSVGGNTALLLNVCPMKNGRFHENDVKRLAELGDFIRESFKDNLADKAEITSTPEKGDRGEDISSVRVDDYETYFKTEDGKRELCIELKWEEGVKASYLVLKENILLSQRVETFKVYEKAKEEDYKEVYDGTVIGYKRIVALSGKELTGIKIEITDSRIAPAISFVGVY